MKAKSLFGPWAGIKASDINRLLKPHGIRLVVKKSRDWGDSVSVTAHPIVAAAGPDGHATDPEPQRDRKPPEPMDAEKPEEQHDVIR